MKRLMLILSMLIIASPAVAGEDDQVPPPPVAPTIPPPPVAPVVPPPAPAPAIDEARLAALIDQAVQRALARCGPMPQSQPSASGQALAPAPVVPSVNVVVPAPACRQLLARLGQWLVKLGQPRIRTLPLAPAAPVRAAPQF